MCLQQTECKESICVIVLAAVQFSVFHNENVCIYSCQSAYSYAYNKVYLSFVFEKRKKKKL